MGGCFQATGFPILPLHKTWPSLIFAWPSARDLRERLFLFIINYRLLRFTIHRDWRDTQIGQKRDTQSSCIRAISRFHPFILSTPNITTHPFGYTSESKHRVHPNDVPPYSRTPCTCTCTLQSTPFSNQRIAFRLFADLAYAKRLRPANACTPAVNVNEKWLHKRRPPSETRFSTTCPLYCFSPSLRHFRLLKAWGRRVRYLLWFFESLKSKDTNAVPA